MGFGSLRTQEGQFAPLDGLRLVKWTYTPVFCVDVRGNTGRTFLFVVRMLRGTIGRTLTDSTPYSMNST